MGDEEKVIVPTVQEQVDELRETMAMRFSRGQPGPGEKSAYARAYWTYRDELTALLKLLPDPKRIS